MPRNRSVPLVEVLTSDPEPSLDERDALDDDPLILPGAWEPPARPPVPVVAALVPLLGAVALWLVTGSAMMLWFAVLGPLIVGGSMLDAARGARRDRRKAAADTVRELERVRAVVERRHAEERSAAWRRHPDVLAYLERDGEIWRASPGRGDAIVVGTGRTPSAVRVSGGDRSDSAVALRSRAARLSNAPVVVPASAGLVVVGAPLLAAGVQRAWIIQLCATLPPGELRIVGPLSEELAWAELLPHRVATTGLRLAIHAPAERLTTDADIVIARATPGTPVPPRCQVVIDAESPMRARMEYGGEHSVIALEALSRPQAEAMAAFLAERAATALGVARDAEPATFAAVQECAPPPRAGALVAAIGFIGRDPAVLDLVGDGPHAVVAGVTGSGKSELLITWILALCATHSTTAVNFLLADFKGGTAFDPLEGLPHVTGVITDLDGAGARRALESLRAEVRWRESVLAEAGARDVLDARVALPRLVIVVDEFAALLGDHPELHAVFADVAARGRALGMHLVIGTQRASGVIRDSLLSNCPLRISLRVTDGADSRTLLGVEDAAQLPGGEGARGRALIRRAADTTPREVRIALSSPDDIDAARHSTGPAPRRPWLPALPLRITLAELRQGDRHTADPLVGLADEPERQRQRPVSVSSRDRSLLVVGGAGAGKTNVLDLIAAQSAHTVIRLPADPESAWDALAELHERSARPGTIVLIDDLDVLASCLPADHSRIALERVEELVRTAGARELLIVAAAQRLSGSVARLADLFALRLILALPTRADHLAAGGDTAHFAADAPPGRGRIGGVAVQVALAPETPHPAPPAPLRPWHPTDRLTGFIARRSPAARAAVAHWQALGVQVMSVDEYVADPSVTARATVMLVGEPDDWQRQWRLLADMRGDHDLVIDSSCGPELRLLTGWRGAPPHLEPGRPRAWLMAAGTDPTRIVLPGA